MNTQTDTVERVIGLDGHPDSFTAAVLQGPTPAAARVQKVFNKVPIGKLRSWAEANTTEKDLVVLEASGNSFQIVRTLALVKRKALVLESCTLGKLKEVHANNDRISAVRIAKAYLAGTAKVVWVPDLRTQERRDWWHSYCKVVKRTTQIANRLQSYLSDNGVRLTSGWDNEVVIFTARTWSERQKQVIRGLLLEHRHANEQRHYWRTLIAEEVLEDPALLEVVRICGVRAIIAFACGAIIGDIKRFKSPGALVKYTGLYPAFDDSGEGEWRGGLPAGHGRQDLRSLLIEAAQSVIRCSTNSLGKWGRRLMARKGSKKLAVAAVARKLAVALWYLMNGHGTPVTEIDTQLGIKIGKILTEVGAERFKELGKTRKTVREEVCQRLKASRDYVLDYHKRFPERPPTVNAIATG